MRVLVTRPEPGASRTATRLVAMGMEPIIRPVARPSVQVSGVEWALSRGWGAAVVTSANAIRALGSMQGALGHFTSKPLFVVGNATADAARKARGLRRQHVHGQRCDLLAMNR